MNARLSPGPWGMAPAMRDQWIVPPRRRFRAISRRLSVSVDELFSSWTITHSNRRAMSRRT